MNKLIVIAFVGLIYAFPVNAQHITDINFADAIRKDCSDCIDADNNLQPPAKDLKKLDVQNSGIESLEGIGEFNSLTVLDIRGNRNLSSLPNLPVSLVELWIGATAINNLESLPPSLQLLECNGCPLTSLPALPATLKRIFCEKSSLTSLPPLPEGLTDLYANYSPILKLPNIPSTLYVLYIYGTKITSLPPFPDGLSYFKITDHTIDCIPSDNPNLWIRDINGDRISTTLCDGGKKAGVMNTEATTEKAVGKCVSGDCENGIGTYVSKKGEVTATYKGSFKNGQNDGKGILTFSDGNSYNGEWKNGVIEGAGTMTFNNGKKSTGIWKGGSLWSGTGYFDFGENGTYYGKVNENMPDGQGVRTYSNGKSFTGTFSKAKAVSGNGYLFYPNDKHSFEGAIVNGEPNGMGIYSNPNGQVFSGNFVNGDLEGSGKWTSPNGGNYNGSFKNSQFDGYGIRTFDDGSIYKGNWSEGKRSGTGSLYDKNGDLDYSGEWSDDKMANPGNAASYKNDLWESAKSVFSRVTFTGWQNQTINGQKGSVDITDELHLNSDYTLYGTRETSVVIGDTRYSGKINISGSYDPVTQIIQIEYGSLIEGDELPDGLTWTESGTGNAKVYENDKHPGYYIISSSDGDDDNAFEETDYQ